MQDAAHPTRDRRVLWTFAFALCAPEKLPIAAAAYASTGQRMAAVDTQTQAVARLEQETAPNVRALIPGFRDRVNRYRRGRPAWSAIPTIPATRATPTAEPAP